MHTLDVGTAVQFQISRHTRNTRPWLARKPIPTGFGQGTPPSQPHSRESQHRLRRSPGPGPCLGRPHSQRDPPHPRPARSIPEVREASRQPHDEFQQPSRKKEYMTKLPSPWGEQKVPKKHPKMLFRRGVLWNLASFRF
jgi:hypothetical protein